MWIYDHTTLRKMRESQGKTMRELCQHDVLDVNIHTLLSWELGRAAPRVDFLAILATAYGVSPDAFFVKK